MKRNKNIDYLRACAILMIVIYHGYAVAGQPWQPHKTIHLLLSFGGEIGVTLFFALSGFGIFWSLYQKEQKNAMPKWHVFMKQRCIRLMPQYYASIFVLLVFQLEGLISLTGFRHILAYCTFTQNFWIETHGSINGALWTMATIVQFYLTAIFLYRMVQKNWALTGGISILISVISKYMMYHYVIPAMQLDSYAYFVYGRQLITALDNFVLGMAAAKIVLHLWDKKTNRSGIFAGAIMTLVSGAGLLWASYAFCRNGIYVDQPVGYVAHSVLAVLIAILMVGISMLPQCEGGLMRPLSFIAKYQYGIYIWHLPVIRGLYNNSPLFQTLIAEGFIPFIVGILFIVIIMGYFSSIWIRVQSK
ncbi:MAG: acyltransferase family protein [Oliverpabstia sp.]